MTEGPAADLMARTGDTRQLNDMLKQAINSNVSQRSGSEVSWSSFCRFFWLARQMRSDMAEEADVQSLLGKREWRCTPCDGA